MAEFVEQGDDVVMRQQRRLATHAFGKVAHQVGHGGLEGAGVGPQPAGADIVHPGTATFAGAGAHVEVELAHQLGTTLDAEELDLRVPHRGSVGADADFEQRFNDVEQPLQHLGCCEVGFDLLFAESVARFLQLFANVGPVPGLRVGQPQVFRRECPHVSQVLFGVGASLGGQVAQEAGDLLGRLGHFGHQRHLRKVGIAQQVGFFLPQGEQALHDGAVVELDMLGRSLVAGAGGVRTVQGLAQGGTVGKLHHRQVARHLQGEFAT